MKKTRCPHCWTPVLVSLSREDAFALCIACARPVYVPCAEQAQARHRHYLTARISYWWCRKKAKV